MTSPAEKDRPTPRRRARPAVDEGRDPADVAPAAAALAATAPVAARRPAAPRPAVRRGPEPTVQLNTRVSQEVRGIVDAECDATGRSQREVVEYAIRQTYGGSSS